MNTCLLDTVLCFRGSLHNPGQLFAVLHASFAWMFVYCRLRSWSRV